MGGKVRDQRHPLNLADEEQFRLVFQGLTIYFRRDRRNFVITGR